MKSIIPTWMGIVAIEFVATGTPLANGLPFWRTFLVINIFFMPFVIMRVLEKHTVSAKEKP